MTVWEAYGRVEFPTGKTGALEEAERQMAFGLKSAKEEIESNVARRRENVEELLKQITDFLAGDAAWKTDKSTMPKSLDPWMVMRATEAIDDLAGYLAADDVMLKGFREKLEAINRENAARAEARKALTFILPEKYTGEDGAALKAFAESVLTKKHLKAKVLRVTLVKEGWSEATVSEWTDSTRSAWRTRTTREMMACLAGKDDTGVYRYFAYLNQDKTSSGQWDALYGHLAQGRDPMLEANVGKDTPAE